MDPLSIRLLSLGLFSLPRVSIIGLLFLSFLAVAQSNNIEPMSQESQFSLEAIGDTKTTEENKDEDKEIEKLEVTGSYIKRIDIEGPAPVKVIDRKMFEVTGSTTIADVLKEDSGFEKVDGSKGYVRFHGQHAGNLLVLLNGLNLPKKDGGFFTSIRSLPSSVIQRVEILKEGGSSLYGSDAMSGVMNFITRSDMEGGSLTSQVTFPAIGVGEEQRHSLAYGTSFARGNILGVFQFERTEAVNEYDLGSRNTNPRVLSVPASYGKLSQKKNKIFLGAACREEGGVCGEEGTACGERGCQSDNLQFDQMRNVETDMSTLLTGWYELPNHIKFSALGIYNRKEERAMGSPLELNWFQKTRYGDQSLKPHLISNNKSSSELIGKGFDLSPLELKYRFDEELGPQTRDKLEQSYNFQGKLEGDIAGSWSWQVHSGFSTLSSQSHMISGNADQRILRQMFYEGSFNPLLPWGQKSDLSAAMVDPTSRNTVQLFTTKLLATGEVVDLGEGRPLSLAIGTDLILESFDFHNDEILTSNHLLTTPWKNYNGLRRISSAFTELSAQLLSGLELQLAGRFDRYSDVGDTWNPKVAVAYRSNSQWLLRSSVGTGFRAPGITDLYRGETQELFFFTDQFRCNNPDKKEKSVCGRKYYPLHTFVAPDLRPETSVHYNFGTTFQPMQSLSLTIDQWNFHGKDTVSRIYPDEYTELERDYLPQLKEMGVSIQRDPVTNELESIRTPYIINMGERILRGVDLEVDGRLSQGPLFVGFGISHSYIFERKTRTFAFKGMERANTSWKNTTSAYLEKGSHYGRLAARTVSSGPASKRKRAKILPRTTVFDISYSYTTPWQGKFNWGVKNVLDRRPVVEQKGPVVAFGHLSRQMTAFSPLGRRFFFSYSQDF